MKRYLAFFKGSVQAEASGGQTERFLSLLYKTGIAVAEPRRGEEGQLIFSVSCKDFKRLRRPAFQTGTHVKILQKKGLFRLMRPLRRRWGLAVGLVLFLGLVFYSSCFIWQVEVVGCTETSVTEIEQDLKSLGLRLGARRTLEVEPIENRYLTGNDKLSWMSINIRGTTAYVEVREKALPPTVEDPTVPTNIYAARDGIIRSIRDYGGERQVEVGEPVTAGQLLVSGDRIDSYGVRRLTHCIATVVAETQHETVVTVPLREQIRQKTGKIRKKFAISFGNFKFPLYFTQKISYNEYDTVEEEVPLRIGNFAFPVRLHILRAEEVETVTVARTAQQARAEALSRLGFYQADALAHTTVLRRELHETAADGELQIRARFYCEEEIGVEMPIEE